MCRTNDSFLPNCLRWTMALSAIVIMILAVCLLYFPPQKSSSELDVQNSINKVVHETSDVTNPFLAIFLTNFALLVYAINGIRFAKLSAAGVTAEATDITENAKRFHDKPSEDRKQTSIEVKDKDSPQPIVETTRVLKANKDKYAVFKLDEIPSSVIIDAFNQWPENLDKPENFSSFEFATRKTGKGNHPWTLKFKDKAVVVSYGGQGKKDSTVKGEK